MAETPPTEQPRILFEDGDLLAISKPSGWHVFSKADSDLSLWNWLRGWHPELSVVGNPAAPAFVHRLDLGTSGLILAARNDATYQALRKAFRDRELVKEYLALIEGYLDRVVECDRPIGGRYRHSKRVFIDSDSRKLRWIRPAKTWVTPLGSRDGLTLCRIRITTGVRHQIRAHLGYLGYPLAGDQLYDSQTGLPGLGNGFFLHASRLVIRHPSQNAQLELTCPVPRHIFSILQTLGLEQLVALDEVAPFC